MILLTLIKKEVIQFFRNKRDILVMLIFPVILIIVLGSALSGLIVRNDNIYEDKIIYYKTNNLNDEDEVLKVFYKFMIEFEKDTNVNFVQINNKDDSIKEINENKAICLLDIYKDNYYYYRNKNKESTESKIFRNTYEQYLKKYNLIKSIQRTNPQNTKVILSKQVNLSLNKNSIESKEINSFTYYTFSELILIILYISNLTSASMYREKYLNTMTRISKVNIFQVILAKIILGIIVGLLQISIVYIISTYLLGVNWGDNLFKIIQVLLGLIIFSSVLGIFMSMISKDEKKSYNILNSLLITMGFLGGSYVPIYLVKSIQITDFLSDLMPTYWANIAIIAISQDMDTFYSNISIVICLALSFLLLIIGNIISKLKVGGSFD